MVEDNLKRKIDYKGSSCLYYFAATLIGAAAYIIWKTKITLFIFTVTVIFFIISLVELYRICARLKKFLNDKKLTGQEKSLYEVLRDIRIDNNERLYDMAERIGISSFDLAQIENGNQENLIKVRDALGKIAIVYNLDIGEIDTLWNGYLTTYQKTTVHKSRCVRIHYLTDEED